MTSAKRHGVGEEYFDRCHFRGLGRQVADHRFNGHGFVHRWCS